MTSEEPRYIESFEEWIEAWNASETVEGRIGLLHCGLTSKGYGDTPEMICFYLGVAVTCKNEKDWRKFDHKILCEKALHMLVDNFFKDELWKKHVAEEGVLDGINKLLQPDSDMYTPYIRLTDILKGHRMEIFKKFLENFYKHSLLAYDGNDQRTLDKIEGYSESHLKLVAHENRLAKFYLRLTDIMTKMGLMDSVIKAHRSLKIIPNQEMLQELRKNVFSSSGISGIHILVGEIPSWKRDHQTIYFEGCPETIAEAVLRNHRMAMPLMELVAIKEGLEQLRKRASIEFDQKKLDRRKDQLKV